MVGDRDRGAACVRHQSIGIIKHQMKHLLFVGGPRKHAYTLFLSFEYVKHFLIK
jgi:hypothetical protein